MKNWLTMLIKHSVRFRVNGRGLSFQINLKGETMMRVEKKEEKAEKTKTKTNKEGKLEEMRNYQSKPHLRVIRVR